MMSTSERAWFLVACVATLATVGGAWVDVRHLLVLLIVTGLSLVGTVVGGAIIYDWVIKGDEDLAERRRNRFR